MNRNVLSAVGRGALFSLLIALLPLAVMVLVPLLNSQYIDPAALPQFILLSVAFGVLVYLVSRFTRKLQEKLGRLTAYAALVGGISVVGTALALTLDTCPGSLNGEACTVPDAASWGLSMGLLVTLIVLTWVFSTTAVSWTRKGASKYSEFRKKAAEKEEEEAFEREVAEGQEAAKDRAPGDPKGYPTRKRKQRKKNKNKKSRNRKASKRKTPNNAH